MSVTNEAIGAIGSPNRRNLAMLAAVVAATVAGAVLGIAVASGSDGPVSAGEQFQASASESSLSVQAQIDRQSGIASSHPPLVLTANERATLDGVTGATNPSRSVQAQIDRLNGIARQYQPLTLTPGQQAEVDRWNGPSDYYQSEPATAGPDATTSRWAGIELRYGATAGSDAQSGLGAVDEFEEKFWRKSFLDDPHAAQDALPDF